MVAQPAERWGSTTERDRLVVGNLAFVVRIAHDYRGLGVAFEDLLAEGNLGLLEAARRFDPGSGVRFITYAVWWIRKRILAALDEQSSVVRTPCHHKKRMREARRVEDSLRLELGRDPRREEVAGRMSPGADRLERTLARHRRVVSLDREPHPGGRGRTLLEGVPCPSGRVDDGLIHDELRDRLLDAVERLPGAERRVIRSRYGLGTEAARTLREIGLEMGLSRERVRQIECRAKDRLRRLIDRRADPARSDIMPASCATSSSPSPRPSSIST
jgi:RNA polymerase primary sigma factor